MDDSHRPWPIILRFHPDHRQIPGGSVLPNLSLKYLIPHQFDPHINNLDLSSQPKMAWIQTQHGGKTARQRSDRGSFLFPYYCTISNCSAHWQPVTCDRFTEILLRIFGMLNFLDTVTRDNKPISACQGGPWPVTAEQFEIVGSIRGNSYFI